MNRAGYGLDAAWFAPHFEFRFPRYGSVGYGSVEIELRQALEPWHVLGEEGAVGGTVRYVDSSVERLQVKVQRHELGPLPDRVQRPPRAARVDRARRGVRRRRALSRVAARVEPASDDPVDSPLVFDLYDRWSGRAVAGCTYHVAHPGGRSFERFPVNSYEAESRRLARFFPFGHTAGAVSRNRSRSPGRSSRTRSICAGRTELDWRGAHSRLRKACRRSTLQKASTHRAKRSCSSPTSRSRASSTS